jgi:hypothetical protein
LLDRVIRHRHRDPGHDPAPPEPSSTGRSCNQPSSNVCGV